MTRTQLLKRGYSQMRQCNVNKVSLTDECAAGEIRGIMRRPWIKIETCTPDKPEICSLSTQLRMDEDTVMGKLVRLWSWAELNRVDPNDLGVTKEFIDRLVGRKGFAVALENTGWLTETNGKLSFRNFKRHNSPVAQNKALTAKRVARHRLRKAEAGENIAIDALSKKEKSVTKKVKKEQKVDNVENVKIPNIDLEISEAVFISEDVSVVEDVTLNTETAVVDDAAQTVTEEALPVAAEIVPKQPEEAASPLAEPVSEEETLVLQVEEPAPKKKRSKAAAEVDDQPMLF